MSKRYALLYSSEEYAEAGRTPFCHADRELLAKALVGSCDYAPTDLVSRGLEPTGDNHVAQILSDLDNVRKRLESGDTVFFYYAGHGTSVGGEPYLILPGTDPKNIEKTALAIRDVSDQLREDGVQCFRIFDSCHSGFDVRDGELDAEPLMRGVLERLPDGWVTLAGCAPDEVCYSSKAEGQGVFTSRLAQAIEEVPVDEDIRPETLKVRTCDLVREWCVDSGKQQTPTLIATVRGNISIATRRAPQATEDEADEGAPETPEIDVKARLADLAGEAPPGSDEYWNRYRAVVETLREVLEGDRNVVQDYAGNLSKADVANVEAVLESIKSEVVDLIYKEGWKSLHHVSKETETDTSPFGSILAISALTGGRSRKITRQLSQAHDMPPSVAHATLNAEGALPGLQIIHYVCPLQSRFLVYSRTKVCGVMDEERTRSHGWYRTVATDGLTDVTHHAEFVHDKAKEMFYEACKANIEYLESEQA